MQLEEMKTLWLQMSVEIENQKRITDSLVIKITESGYQSKIRKILVPEAIGSLVCFAELLFIIINFQKLTTLYLFFCGIISAVILFALPVLSLKAIFSFRSVNISRNNYKELLLSYSKGKIQFVFAQKMSFYLGAILLLTALPVMGQLIAGVDLFKVTSLWLWYTIAFPFYYFLARWVYKSYIKSTVAAENILKELDN